VLWQDQHFTYLKGGRAAVEEIEGVIYMAASLRNAGNGIAVLHGWYVGIGWHPGPQDHPPVEDFRRLSRDLYLPAGDVGFWQGTFRNPEAPEFAEAREGIERRLALIVDLLYGDHEGGQRVITRFALRPLDGEGWTVTAARHWNLDRADPR